IIGTTPEDVREEADEAVAGMGWGGHYFVDADHINLKTADLFVKASDFFTLDVTDYIGQSAEKDEIDNFIDGCVKYIDGLAVPGIEGSMVVSENVVRAIADRYLHAVKEAGEIYRHVASKKGVGNFVVELSMDETDTPQSPVELFFILAAAAQGEIPVQTISPKFSGRFNKGVDYVGDVGLFTREFEQDVAIVAYAAEEFGLPKNLKLSVHSGSDKFSIYGAINKALRKFDAGLHVKTAGTTWLEELAGLAIAEGEGLRIARQIYAEAFSQIDELTKPYATVIDIDKGRLPSPEVVAEWNGKRFAEALRHDQSCGRYNPDLRQLLHVGYKVAAEMGTEFTDAVADCERIIGPNVTENIYQRHIKPIFID
ncbi:MAG: tagaturonate epimerase family protein, partial [Sedimentisphaerales bacterium]